MSALSATKVEKSSGDLYSGARVVTHGPTIVVSSLTNEQANILHGIYGILSGSQCQRADWPTHRSMCGPESVWYDKHRKCMDGRMHEGRLELITWECPQEQTGWGHCLLAEADDLRRTFETRYNSDEERFFGYWPQGFRWTCCGLEGDITYGCDHHGTGSRPCTCDYCRYALKELLSSKNETILTSH